MAQGTLAALQGQSFGSAFRSAAISNFVSSFGPSGGSATAGVMRAIIGGTASSASGGKFANGAATALAAWAAESATEQYSARQARRGQVVPEGADPEDYGTIYVGGAHGVLSDFSEQVRQGGADTFGYFLPSEGGAADIFRSIGEKFSPDGFSDYLSDLLAGVDHPLTFVAYSEGTAVVANAALNGGLPRGSVLYFNSPIISYATASAAADAIHAPLMIYNLPPDDIANFIAPGRNFFSGFYDLTHGMQVHNSTQFGH